MSKKIVRDLCILILILAVLGLGAFGISKLLPTFTGPKDSEQPQSKLTISWEKSLSNVILDHLERQYASKILTRKEYRQTLNEIVARLEIAVEKSQGGPLPFETTLLFIDSPVENAFAFPGGIIVVNSGLVKITDTPEQLAAVIAHEMGHVYYRDAVNAMSRSIGLGILLSFGGGSGTAELLEEILRTLVENTFSREQESRADKFAVSVMAEASLPPDALADFFEKLETNEEAKETFKYMSTHPITKDRIEEVRRMTAETSHQNQKPQPFDMDWKAYKNSLPGIF